MLFGFIGKTIISCFGIYVPFYGFPKEGDLVKASGTIQLEMRQCNTKRALFLALCRAFDIPARMDFSPIKKEIQRGH